MSTNALYEGARRRMLQGQLNVLTDTLKVYLVDAEYYTVDTAGHEFLSSVPAPARIAGPITLSNKAVTTAGAFDADDVTFSSVSGASGEAIILYKDSGDEATSPLILYLGAATGLPITPNGGDISAVWDNGTNRIFRP